MKPDSLLHPRRDGESMVRIERREPTQSVCVLYMCCVVCFMMLWRVSCGVGCVCVVCWFVNWCVVVWCCWLFVLVCFIVCLVCMVVSVSALWRDWVCVVVLLFLFML